jgi:hypothetical protein
MSGVKYFDTREGAEVCLKVVLTEWPAAKIHPDGGYRLFITGDYACTKFLHEDGHVY